MPALWSTAGPLPLAPPGGILWRGSSKLVSPIGITDGLSLRADYARTINDTVGITDNLSAARIFTAPATDSIGITDSLAASLVHAPAFDAVGAAYAGISSTPSWLETIAANAAAILVGANINSASAPATLTATVGSTPMTLLQNLAMPSGGGRVVIFGLLAPPTGSQTVTISIGSHGSGSVFTAANSASYINVSSFGTVATNTGTGTALSLSVPSSAGQRVFQIFGNAVSSGSLSGYNQTSRYNQPYTSGTNFPTVMGDAAGAATVSFSATGSSGAWAGAGVPLIP